MSNIFSPFFLVATMVVAVGAAGVSQAQAVNDAAHIAQLRQAAGQASSVGPAVLVLAAK